MLYEKPESRVRKLEYPGEEFANAKRAKKFIGKFDSERLYKRPGMGPIDWTKAAWEEQEAELLRIQATEEAKAVEMAEKAATKDLAVLNSPWRRASLKKLVRRTKSSIGKNLAITKP